jgi:Uma2 family endonuclease
LERGKNYETIMATVQMPRGRCLVLDGIDWRTYSRLVRLFAGRPAVRLAFDQGRLEIMHPLPEHETAAYILGRFIDTLTEELRLPVKAGRSTTFRRRRRQRGLEADNSYWIANEAKVRGQQSIDLRRDPPPDLAIEIDLTHSSLDRMGIYAALRVPEVWRLDRHALTCHVLGADATYEASAQSRAFPQLKMTDIEAFLALRYREEDNTIVRQFREWVRANLAPPTPQ